MQQAVAPAHTIDLSICMLYIAALHQPVFLGQYRMSWVVSDSLFVLSFLSSMWGSVPSYPLLKRTVCSHCYKTMHAKYTAHDSGGSGFLFINVCCAAIDSLKNKSNKTRKAKTWPPCLKHECPQAIRAACCERCGWVNILAELLLCIFRTSQFLCYRCAIYVSGVKRY